MEKQTKVSFWLIGLAFLFGILGLRLLPKLIEFLRYHNTPAPYLSPVPVAYSCFVILFLVGFAGSVIFNVITYMKKGVPRDLQKLGWLGFLGLLGLLSPKNYGYFALFVLFYVVKKRDHNIKG